MFGRLFQKRKSAPATDREPSNSEDAGELKTQALLDAIAQRSAEDPLVAAKIGAKEVYHRLVEGLRNDKGVHIESLLCILCSLAGYACQASLRAQSLAKGEAETAAFQIVRTKDEATYFFGDPLNNLLVGAEYSVWSLAGGAAQQAGATEFPDLRELFEHTSAVVGSFEFGLPRIPDGHAIGDLPFNYLTAIWPKLLPTVKLFCGDPAQWPILFGLAIQEAIYASKEVIAPALALKLVMECAIPMSKVDLASA